MHVHNTHGIHVKYLTYVYTNYTRSPRCSIDGSKSGDHVRVCEHVYMYVRALRVGQIPHPSVHYNDITNINEPLAPLMRGYLHGSSTQTHSNVIR